MAVKYKSKPGRAAGLFDKELWPDLSGSPALIYDLSKYDTKPNTARDLQTQVNMSRGVVYPTYTGEETPYKADPEGLKRSAAELEYQRNMRRDLEGKYDDAQLMFQKALQKGDLESAYKSSQNTEEYRNGLKARLAKLDKEIEDIDKDIAVASHPLFKLAMMRMIDSKDPTMYNSIVSSIENEKNRRSTAAENEKSRQNTLEVAKMNRDEQKKAQQQDRENAYASALQLYNFALGDLEANPTDPKAKREVEKSRELLRQAAEKAGKTDEFGRMVYESKSSAKWNEAAEEYGVEGKEGLVGYYNSLKTPKEKARFLRDLKNTFGINEMDLGLSGAETKINENKANAAKTLEQKITAVVKSYGKGADGKKARDDALKALSADVKAKVVGGYKNGEYIIKRKGK